MIEDISPSLDSIDIILHPFAVLNSVWKHPDDCTNIFNTINEMELFEVIESLLNFVKHWGGSLKATLELSQMVVASESIDQSCYKVWYSIKRGQVEMIMNKLMRSIAVMHWSVHNFI